MDRPKQKQYLSDEAAALPLHVLNAHDTPITPVWDRNRVAGAARAERYECYPFYKFISRPVPRTGDEESSIRGRARN